MITPIDRTESRLLGLAALFLFLYCTILSLSPAVRLHTWAVAYLWQHWIGFAVWLMGFAVARTQVRRLLPDRDAFLLPLAALLTGWGLVSVWRIDPVLGLRQTAWLGVALAALIAGLRIPNNLGLLRRYKYLWLTGGLLLTALTFFFGTYPGGVGPRLWLGCCGVYLQPSEPLKLLLIIYLAAYLADALPVNFSLAQLVAPTLVLLGAALALLVGQRDLGTATLFIFLYATILYIASGRRRIPLLCFLGLGLASLLAYRSFAVVRVRIDAWLNPWLDPSGRSYQIVQSLIAIASGGVFGSGPGLGSPSLVPVAHSDFIFSAIAEETGLAGSLALFLLIALLVARGLRAALRAPKSYQRTLAAGLALYLGAQSLLIIGGNLRLFPLTGVTLPFVSYGGSSLLTSFIATGILLQISSQAEGEPLWLPRPTAYQVMAGGFLVVFVSAALLNGWWSLYRQDDLRLRLDNPRRAVADRFVRRGAILDKDGDTLNRTTGDLGSYTRLTTYPPLSPALGYTNPLYGQAGLEASLDPYLRGLQGYPDLTVGWTSLVYDQPPPGLDVRLSLDLDRQKHLDALLGPAAGAAVLMNASTGEVLAIASHPYFDPGKLNQDGAAILNDPSAPLLDRASLGQYPPGTALGPFLLVEATRHGLAPPLPENPDLPTPGGTIACSQPLPANPTWGSSVASGCPAGNLALGQSLGESGLLALLKRLGFFSTPSSALPAASQPAPAALASLQDAAIGRGEIKVSPLQMALAAASLTAGGSRPAPRLAIAVNTPDQGWAVLPPEGQPVEVFPVGVTQALLPALAQSDKPYWQVIGRAPNPPGGRVTWFVGGSLPGWQGSPLVLALVLEQDNPTLAGQIGSAVLEFH